MAQQGQQLDLNTLTAQQLLQIKKQLDSELEHLNNSFNQLRIAQSKFLDCIRTLERGLGSPSPSQAEGKPVLVPLTTSLYVPGTLDPSPSKAGKVIVDVGTGFFVEKSIDEAKSFYEEKSKEIGGNLKDLEKILEGKGQNLRMVEEVLRAKVAAGEKLEGTGGTAQQAAIGA